jgi:TonB family protein
MKTTSLILAGIVLACPHLSAQGTSSLAPPDERAKEIHDIGIHHALDASAFQVLNKTTGKELGIYPDRVLAMVRKKWYPLVSRAQASGARTGTTVVEFTVQRDGTLARVKKTLSANDSALDEAASQAINEAAPFPPLPSEYRDKSLTMRYTFGYNQQPTADRPLCGKPRTDSFRRGPGVVAPRALVSPDPEYAEEARRAKYQGVVLVGGTVEPDGTFSDLCIEQAVGHGLDERAIQAVKTWKFKPATKDGQPIPVHISVEVSFRLY